MGVYYKLVNRETKERIEPQNIGGGGIKFGALIAGPSSKLLMFLHLQGESGWTVLSDKEAEYLETEDPNSHNFLSDATDKYRRQYNVWWDGNDVIPLSPYAPSGLYSENKT